MPSPAGWEDVPSGIEGPSFWKRVLVNEVARASRYRRSLTVVVLEIEGLAAMADTWGEDIGRHAVHQAGECLRRSSRTSDYCARIDGSRFGIVLTETDEIAAINFVERLREAMPVALPREGAGLRLCFGWASPRTGDSPASLVERAERRLIGELSR